MIEQAQSGLYINTATFGSTETTLRQMETTVWRISSRPTQREEDHIIRRVIPRGDFEMNTLLGVVSINGADIPLTPTQATIMECLAMSPGKPIGRRVLADVLDPGNGAFITDVNINTHVSRMRQALGEDTKMPGQTVASIWGRGFMFAADPRGTR